MTQNIDGLHQKAGSKHVVELHGTLRTLSCTECFKQFESAGYLKAYIENGKMPRCESCNGILKPDVILFGEQLPQSHGWRRKAQRVNVTDAGRRFLIGSPACGGFAHASP